MRAPLTAGVRPHMPKRTVKRVCWELESERTKLTPAMERRIFKSVVTRSEKVLREFTELTEEEKLFYEIPTAALAAYNLQRYSEAAELARRSIALAESFKDNWNYANAIHYGHTVLGLLALRENNPQGAIEQLHASSHASGSPQLGSFGPLMQLAKELLKQGQAEQVLIFLHQCRTFWKMGDSWISIWEKKIARGAIPNFFMNLYR